MKGIGSIHRLAGSENDFPGYFAGASLKGFVNPLIVSVLAPLTSPATSPGPH